MSPKQNSLGPTYAEASVDKAKSIVRAYFSEAVGLRLRDSQLGGSSDSDWLLFPLKPTPNSCFPQCSIQIISPEGLNSGSPGYVRGSMKYNKSATPDGVEVCQIF